MKELGRREMDRAGTTAVNDLASVAEEVDLVKIRSGSIGDSRRTM